MPADNGYPAQPDNLPAVQADDLLTAAVEAITACQSMLRGAPTGLRRQQVYRILGGAVAKLETVRQAVNR